MGAFLELFRELAAIVNDERMQEDAGPILSEIQSVVRMVALEVLEIRGSNSSNALCPTALETA
jgi:hypothetical protein